MITVAFGAWPRARRRSRRPCEGADGAGQSGGGGGQGAAPEVPGSQPPANSEFLRHELGRASVSTLAHPLLPARAPPSAGWEALPRPGTPRSALRGDAHTPLFLPGLCLARKGTLWGVLAGVLPFYHTRWPGLTGSCSCPSGPGRAGAGGGGDGDEEQGQASLDRTAQVCPQDNWVQPPSSARDTWHPLPRSSIKQGRRLQSEHRGEAWAWHPGALGQEDPSLLLGFHEQWAKATGDWGAHMPSLAEARPAAAP